MKKFIIIAALVFLFFLSGVFFQKSFLSKNPVVSKAQSFTVYQSISFDPKKTASFSKYQALKGETAYELLGKTAVVEEKGTGKNIFIVSINGYRAQSDKKEYWAFYVNDALSVVGAAGYQLSADDKIQWKIEKY